MRNKSKHIPVNTLPAGTREGIIIGRASFNGRPDAEEVERSHRDNGHLFILQEKGKTRIEIDFQEHVIKAPAIIYIHPDQVHRLIAFERATTCSWIVTSENLHPEYLKILEDLAPANVLRLNASTLELIAGAASLCIEFAQRQQEPLYNYILKESCNTLITLVASQYLAQVRAAESPSRYEAVTRAFRLALEEMFTTAKSPSVYARRLNLSTPYLNECVKAATGHPVSYHIQQRVVLEAKRLLYHSSQSVKEIAAAMGYDDYSYFTRLFVKVTGMTPVAFRDKNLD